MFGGGWVVSCLSCSKNCAARSLTEEGLTAGGLRRTVAELVEEEPESITDEMNLFEAGLDSIVLMQLVGRWRRAGVDIDFAELAQRPTIGAWATLLDAPYPHSKLFRKPAAGARNRGSRECDGDGRGHDNIAGHRVRLQRAAASVFPIVIAGIVGCAAAVTSLICVRRVPGKSA